MAHEEEKRPMIGITRHAAQALLHHAIEAQPEICCGLLYGSSNNTGTTIRRILPVTNTAAQREQACTPERTGIELTLTGDGGEPLLLLGPYRSFPTLGIRTDDMLADMPALPQTPDTAKWYGAVSLCTKGRLEIHIFSTLSGTWREHALEMEEDGTLYRGQFSG
ncbi:MAG TPA: hypothetical protein VJ961_09425 [Mariprofundaceae bacterium]|nr:hypothetical protein [Mariprofundaceae bacterium]